MNVYMPQFSVLLLVLLLAGCTATSIDYTPVTKSTDKIAEARFIELTLSQLDSRSKPSHIEILDTSILWGKDRMYFSRIKNVELLQKADKYLVQVNFHGDYFRGKDWFIVYKTHDLEEAKSYIDTFTSLISTKNGAVPR